MQVIKRHSGLPDLFENFNCLLPTLRTDLDERTAKLHLKVPLNLSFIPEDQEKYLQCLTPFAYGFIDARFQKEKKYI